jgi:hypothetical protein
VPSFQYKSKRNAATIINTEGEFEEKYEKKPLTGKKETPLLGAAAFPTDAELEAADQQFAFVDHLRRQVVV